jgi:CBS-domain-containing membrane protein
LFAGWTVSCEKAYGRTAGAVMARNVVTVAEDTPLNEIAELLERHHIKRVPVLSDGRLAGIVSRAWDRSPACRCRPDPGRSIAAAGYEKQRLHATPNPPMLR